jgi:hypothetical protein
MIAAKEILAPSTGATGTSESFDVDDRSRTVYLAPNAGETLTEDDTYELRRVVAEGPVRSIKVVDAGTDVLLGANNVQFEVLIRGTYLVKKILSTTESVGVYQTYGIEEGS